MDYMPYMVWNVKIKDKYWMWEWHSVCWRGLALFKLIMGNRQTNLIPHHFYIDVIFIWLAIRYKIEFWLSFLHKCIPFKFLHRLKDIQSSAYLWIKQKYKEKKKRIH